MDVDVQMMMGVEKGEMNEKKILIELARGRFSREKLEDEILPWQMTDDEVFLDDG